ncbi:tigger transposable element-derived protein 1-like [Portunus trituberculatus]|uniref:tigger transposable element-derived protein 1-like n=1 Tax=Portunus trituberculatus TaxID=210409 RepID=UPI001E1CF9D2|nr:tigger transposable element-derived protein 1-like [Portunus trituberculatus]
MIQEKALSLFNELKAEYGEDVSFTASHGWFNCFKARNNLHDVKVSGEAASADVKAAEEFPGKLTEIICQEATHHNRFSTWMKLASTGKKCLTEPTSAIFQEWFYNQFIPEVKKYCRSNSIPFNVLLVLDNALGHPSYLDDFHPNVKVVYLPPNTTSIIQPMDQGVIVTFKKYYLRCTFRQALKATDKTDMTLSEFWKSYNIYNAIKNINTTWREVTTTCMNAVWKKLCPQVVHDFTGFENIQQEQEEVVDNLISMSEKLELELEEQDFTEFFDDHDKELSNDELRELEKQRKEAALANFEEEDPNEERHAKVSAAVHDEFKCYRIIYEEKKKAVSKSSLHWFFKRVDKREATVPSTPQSVPSTPEPVSSSSSTHTPDADSDADDPSPIS